MRQRRTLVWTTLGCVVAVVAVVLVVTHGSSDTPGGGSSPAPPATVGDSSPASESAPVVTPDASGTYLSDLHPSGHLAGSVTPGPVKISGSIYPRSISFYCNVGDATAFPTYRLGPNDRRFQATIGLAPNSPSQFTATVFLVADGRRLRTVNVTVPKPKTVDVGLHGVRTLQLECFGGGNSATGGEAVDLEWGNARLSGGH
jgi:hypothetical protein